MSKAEKQIFCTFFMYSLEPSYHSGSMSARNRPKTAAMCCIMAVTSRHVMTLHGELSLPHSCHLTA